MNSVKQFAIFFLHLILSQTSALDPISHVLQPGDTFRMSCSFNSTKTDHLLYWTKGNSTSDTEFSIISPYQAQDTRISFQNSPTVNTLIITSVNPNDQGMYKCSEVDVKAAAVECSYDEYGERECRHWDSSVRDIKLIDLKVTHKPYIIESESTTGKVRIVQGSDATLKCKAGGYPKPIVYWERADGSRIMSGSTKHPCEELELRQVTQVDAGTYICIADNSIGGPPARMAVEVIVSAENTTEVSTKR